MSNDTPPPPVPPAPPQDNPAGGATPPPWQPGPPPAPFKTSQDDDAGKSGEETSAADGSADGGDKTRNARKAPDSDGEKGDSSGEERPGRRAGGQPRGSSWGGMAALLLIAAIVWGFFWNDGTGADSPRDIEYSPDFVMLVNSGLVRKVEIVRGDGLCQIRGTVAGENRTGNQGDGGIQSAEPSSVPREGEKDGASSSQVIASPAKADLRAARNGAAESSPPHIGEGTVATSRVDGQDAVATLADVIASKYPTGTKFRVQARASDDLERFLLANGVSYDWKQQDPRITFILVQILPSLVFFGLVYWFFFRRMGGRDGLGFGKSRAQMVVPTGQQRVTFKDVAGCDEAKEDVVEVVEYLKNPGKFGRLGGKMPRGILLSGPPGTGKTLLAKAIAGEADVPFFSISGSDFVEMFVGVGASRVRDMFVQAKKQSPCLVFIDEIDAVGRRRGAGIGGGHDEREQTLNALLVEMDGFGTNSGIVVIAATNRPDVLDPALLRPGRFDRQLVVDLPTMEGRLEILKVHAAKVKLAPGTDLSKIARGTPGCSGADLANIVNEAALVAARAEKPGVDEDDFEAARDKVLWGKERRSHAMDEEEKRLTAYHEAGHAVCAVLEKHADPVHKVTIIPRGMALGLTAFLPKKDRTHYSRSQILADLVVSMGGRAAEEVFLDDVSTGARQDIKQATALAHSFVCDWGLSEVLGPRAYGKNEELVFLGAEVNRTQDYGDEAARKIDEEVDGLIRDAHSKALAHLRGNRSAVEELVRRLLEKETVDGSEVEAIVRGGL